jgi:hypothetical protein
LKGDPMERFYFHLRVHGRMVWDEEGMYLADMEAANAEMFASARDFRAASRAGSVEMTNAQGTLLNSMPVSGALH